jgi:hypothetical protein
MLAKLIKQTGQSSKQVKYSKPTVGKTNKAIKKNRQTSKNQPFMLAKSIQQNPMIEQGKINQACKQNQSSK